MGKCPTFHLLGGQLSSGQLSGGQLSVGQLSVLLQCYSDHIEVKIFTYLLETDIFLEIPHENFDV